MNSFPFKINKWNSIICILLHSDAQVPHLEIQYYQICSTASLLRRRKDPTSHRLYYPLIILVIVRAKNPPRENRRETYLKRVRASHEVT